MLHFLFYICHTNTRTMSKFYVVQVIIKRQGYSARGFVCIEKGVIGISDTLDGRVEIFTSFQEAQDFIKERKINKAGMNAYVKSSEELMVANKSDMAIVSESANELFYIEQAGTGKKVCFTQGNYVFRDCTVGFCVWKKDDNLTNMLKVLEDKNFKVTVKNMNEIKNAE